MACHLRSVSLPSTPHVLVLKIEEDLQQLKVQVASSSFTAQTMCDALKGTLKLYEYIKELLCLPSCQNGLSDPQQKKCIEEELEGSVRLLDLCRTMQDNLGAMRMHIQDLRSTFRRERTVSIENKVQAYIRFTKKASKDVKKQMASKSESTSPVKEDVDLLLIVRMLIEAREITTSLLHSIMSFLSKQIVKQNSSMWSLVSKTFQSGSLSCKQEEEDDIFSFYACKQLDKERILKALKQLHTLEINIPKLEDGIECLFRQLIQSRVSLLNTLSS